MKKNESQILSHLHDTLFLCLDGKEIMSILSSFSKDFEETEDKSKAVDVIVGYVENNFKDLVNGNQVSLPGRLVNIYDGVQFRLNDAIMNLDMVKNNENPASIVEHYRANPIDPDFMVGNGSLIMSNGDSLKISKGNVYINDALVEDSPEVFDIQQASIEWLSKAQDNRQYALEDELSL